MDDSPPPPIAPGLSAFSACEPVFDQKTLQALYPDAALRRSLLLRALEYAQRDRSEAFRLIELGHYAEARSLVHRLKGTVCLLTSDTAAYALFDYVDRQIRSRRLARIDSASALLRRYLDLLELALARAADQPASEDRPPVPPASDKAAR